MSVKLPAAVSALVLLAAICGCKTPINPNHGFKMQTRTRNAPAGCTPGSTCANLGPRVPAPNIEVSGDFDYDIQTNPGTVQSFDTFTTLVTKEDVTVAQAYISNARVPANWDIYATFPYYCGPDFLYAQAPNLITGTMMSTASNIMSRGLRPGSTS